MTDSLHEGGSALAIFPHCVGTSRACETPVPCSCSRAASGRELRSWVVCKYMRCSGEMDLQEEGFISTV